MNLSNEQIDQVIGVLAGQGEKCIKCGSFNVVWCTDHPRLSGYYRYPCRCMRCSPFTKDTVRDDIHWTMQLFDYFGNEVSEKWKSEENLKPAYTARVSRTESTPTQT